VTLLVASISGDNLDQIQERATVSWSEGAEAVELRIDAFEGDPAALAAYLKGQSHRTWIVTCRSAAEGGLFRGNTMERVSLLLAAARGTDAYVDFEFADWQRSANIRQKVLLAAARADGSHRRLVLSAHDFGGPPLELGRLLDEVLQVPEVSAAKVAFQAGHINDSFEALDQMHRRGGRATVIAMGDDGLWTRVLARKLGSFATYCSMDPGSSTAPGQATLAQMSGQYGWSTMGPTTKVFGVLGDPVAHSMSPTLFGHWFAEAGLNAVYLPLRVRGGARELAGFLDNCKARPWLDLGGFSVTLPHKTQALKWSGEGADSASSWIGAANTLVFREGTVRSLNTDCPAAVASMIAALDCTREDCAGLEVHVLGAGGAARAVVHGLYELGCDVTVFGRSPEKTLSLASKYGAKAAAWEDRSGSGGRVLINCTSMGMWPDVTDSPMSKGSLPGYRLVFDLIYNPLQTRLLRDAAEMGCATLNGIDMFVRQAAKQFELWTGIWPDLEAARGLVADEIQRRSGVHHDD